MSDKSCAKKMDPSFSLLVKPVSADCNLRCDYCFYLQNSALYPSARVHRMSDDILEKMIAGFMALNLPGYVFGWQGGEPTLMGVDFFRRVTGLQQKYGRTGAVVSNGLQTNATLITDEFAEHLGGYKFLVGVSLDGPAGIHDRYRRHANGRGSHEQVMAAIRRLKKYGVEFNVLVLVNDKNVGKAREIYRYLCDQGFLYHQYIPCVEFDEQNRPLPFTITGEQWGDFLCEIYDCWIGQDTRRVSIRHFDAVIGRLADNSCMVCTMGRDCRQYFVVEYNGDIYPCDFFVRKELFIGNVADTTWKEALESPVYRKFGRRKSRWNARCARCPYLSLCAGDCQKHRVYGNNDPGNLSRLCAGWRRFHEHALPGLKNLAARIVSERQNQAPESSRIALSAGIPGRTGRNDPCPCGSGLKYKKCCWGKNGK